MRLFDSSLVGGNARPHPGPLLRGEGERIGALSLKEEKTFNIQRPTANIQRAPSGRTLDVGSSMLDVGCSHGFRERADSFTN
jgi:hypothetical protein